MATEPKKVCTLLVEVTENEAGAIEVKPHFSGKWSGFIFNAVSRAIQRGYRVYQAEQRRKGEQTWVTQKSSTTQVSSKTSK